MDEASQKIILLLVDNPNDFWKKMYTCGHQGAFTCSVSHANINANNNAKHQFVLLQKWYSTTDILTTEKTGQLYIHVLNMYLLIFS